MPVLIFKLHFMLNIHVSSRRLKVEGRKYIKSSEFVTWKISSRLEICFHKGSENNAHFL